MSQMDLNALLQQAQQAQQRIAEVQRDLARRTVEGQSGAGMVTAVASGELRVVEVRIDPQLLGGGDKAMIEDLVAAAVNNALERAREMAQKALQEVAGGQLQIRLPGQQG